MAPVNWLASYPKSGNTWMRFMLACYLTNRPVTSVRVGPLNSVIPIIGGGGKSLRELPADHTGPLIVKTHSVPGADALRPYRAATRKVVYLVRNPRDIILSLTKAGVAKQVSAEDVASHFIANRGIGDGNPEHEWGSWPQNVRAWTTPAVVRQLFPDADALTLRYEDMRADPPGALYQVLDFLDLGQPVDPDNVAQAVESSSIENMHALWAQEETTNQNHGEGRKFRAGRGLSNQSLADLGTDIEDEYKKLFQADDELAVCARQFGYTG